MIYFTADLHLGHNNIIKHCNRPFASVDDMDEQLISRWNARVRPSDTIYILGDLIFRNGASAASYLNRLTGEKHLVLGNHDWSWTKKVELSKYFVSAERLVEISDGSRRLVLCHYPMMSWNQMERGSYMIHGHIHNRRDAAYFSLLQRMSGLLNAGVDINGFYPVGFDELVYNNDVFKHGLSGDSNRLEIHQARIVCRIGGKDESYVVSGTTYPDIKKRTIDLVVRMADYFEPNNVPLWEAANRIVYECNTTDSFLSLIQDCAPDLYEVVSGHTMFEPLAKGDDIFILEILRPLARAIIASERHTLDWYEGMLDGMCL